MTKGEALNKIGELVMYARAQGWDEMFTEAFDTLYAEPCEDCVSRHEVMCAINSTCVHYELARKLRKLPPVTPKPRWIPVSERLPENSGNYLVCGCGKVWICEMLGLCGVRGWCNDAKNPVVEAWMPLPEPYKAESEEK